MAIPCLGADFGERSTAVVPADSSAEERTGEDRVIVPLV